MISLLTSQKTVKINNKYSVNLDSMYQYRTNDPTKQRMIKREEVSLSESDSDEPPKKKAKVDTNSLVGQSVCKKSDKMFAENIYIFS